MTGIKVWLMTILIYGAVGGICVGIRTRDQTKDEEAAATRRQADEERAEKLRFFQVALGKIKGPETSYFRMLRETMSLKQMEHFGRSLNPSQVVDLIDHLMDSDDKITAFFREDSPQVFRPLAALHKHKSHRKVSEAATNSPVLLNQVLLSKGTFTLPNYLTRPAPPVPPLRFWQLSWWMWPCLIALGMHFVVLVVLCGPLGNRRLRHIARDYPWWTFGGILSMTMAAPTFTLYFLAYGTYRAINTDWKPALGRTWRGLRQAAYQLRLIRTLPPPALEPTPLMPAGRMEVTAAPEPPANLNLQQMPQPDANRERPDGAQWFAFRPELLRGRHQALEEAGLKPVEIALTQPREMRCAALPASAMFDFEQLLGLLETPVEYERTDVRSMHLCTYRREFGHVSIIGADQHKERIQIMMENLSADFGGLDIRFDSSQRCLADPPQPVSGVNVFHCTRPCGTVSEVRTRRIFGQNLEGEGIRLLEPVDGLGLVIRDADGLAVGQVIGRCVFTLTYYLVHNNQDWTDEGLASIIRAGIEAILEADRTDTADQTAAGLEKAWRESLDDRRRAYIDMAMSRFQGEVSQLEAELDDLGRAVAESRQHLTDSLRRQREVTGRLASLREGPMRLKQEELVAEFDQLAQSPYVISVECRDGWVDVYTRSIFVEWNDRRFELGRYRLRLSDTGQVGIVNVANTAKKTDWHHPHVSSRHGICFGNLNESIARYLSERQFAVVTSLLYRFLENYNPHGGVEDITKWKEVTDDQPA